MPNHMKNCSFNLQSSGRTICEGVELELKGNLQQMDSRFSVNFRFGSGIAYHFGLRLHEKGHHEVFQGFKDIEWEELDTEVWPKDSEEIKKGLTFRLCGEEIVVYVDGAQQCKAFEIKVPFEKITGIELWDDIKWVEEVNLRFNTNGVK
uniref:Galectin n=1 Tax=Culex tarsalis TaxID=7177 RepID=A0A1Q3FGL0_CULTA